MGFEPIQDGKSGLLLVIEHSAFWMARARKAQGDVTGWALFLGPP
jgi:hypothetical protein